MLEKVPKKEDFNNSLFVSVTVVSEQDLVLKLWCYRNVGQIISGYFVRSAVNWCLCPAK